MKFSLRLLLALFMLASLPANAAASDQEDRQILRLLNRLSFGPASGDIDAVRRIGMDAYIEQQLYPQSFVTPPYLDDRLRQLTVTRASLRDLAEQYQAPTQQSPGMREESNKQLNEITFEISEAKILRAVLSPAQLQEVMADFWFNHFNVFSGKDLDRLLIGTYERDAIRPYALGKFRDLLGATAHHPAMLFYLDNWQNTDPDSPQGRRAAIHRKELGINENYAREIMELHTLGVDGGYSQQDVTTLAHILTGWGIGRGRGGQDWADRAVFYFDPQRHDFNSKLFLGRTIEGRGSDEVEEVLDILASSPATAHHIAYELAQYFVADDPPPSLVNKLAAAFETSSGDIAVTLRALFHAPEFWDPHYEQGKFKPPFRYVVSALRAGNAGPEGDTRMLQGVIADMGEPLYRCQTPNGYANTNDQWLNSDALLKRIAIAKNLAHVFGDPSGGTIYAALGNNWSASTIGVVQNAEEHLKSALLLSSPEFLYY